MAPNEYPESEGMQVVPPHEGLQVVPQQQGLEVVPSQGLESIEKKKDDTAAYQGIEVANEHHQSPEKIGKTRYKRVCGLTYRAFAIVIVVLVAVIVAAVVGGVVGSRKSTINNE
jgi:t-SNARE complex subunit (syntaxin)